MCSEEPFSQQGKEIMKMALRCLLRDAVTLNNQQKSRGWNILGRLHYTCRITVTAAGGDPIHLPCPQVGLTRALLPPGGPGGDDGGEVGVWKKASRVFSPGGRLQPVPCPGGAGLVTPGMGIGVGVQRAHVKPSVFL